MKQECAYCEEEAVTIRDGSCVCKKHKMKDIRISKSIDKYIDRIAGRR